MRTFRSVELSVVIAVLQAAAWNLSAQTPPRDQRPIAKTGAATIRGRVLAGDTGRPLRRVKITVSAPELAGNNRTASTDADGRYEITELSAGQYTVTVTRSGYLTLRYGQRRPLEQGKPLQVLDKQTVDHIDFSLPRMSVIAGRVLDEIGDPIAGVMVTALRSRYWEGRRQLVPTGAGLVQSDDGGQYRILGLAPGTYYVMANTRETWTITESGVTRTMGFAPTYFPGVTGVADARRITVALGQEVSNTDFSLTPGRASTISGTAFDSQGRPFGRNVALREEIRGENFSRFGGTMSAAVAADGTFTIRNVPPGEYKLVASTGRDTEHPEAAIVPITIDGVDVTDVTLTGSAGGSITGQVLTDTGAVPTIPRMRVSTGGQSAGQPDPALLGTFGNPGFGPVAADGSFSITGVFGRSPLRLTLPDGWMVKATMYEGRDITDTPIELKSGESMSGVQVIVTDRVSSVTGDLADDKGLPLTDATILVFADDPAQWTSDTRTVRAVRPDQVGHYQIKALPAGAYRAIALDYVEDGLWNDPEYLAALRPKAQPLTVVEAMTQSITLKLVSAEAAR